VGQSDLGENLTCVFPTSSCLLQGYARYFFERFSLRFFLFSALSFLVVGFFFELFPIPNSITTLKWLKERMKFSVRTNQQDATVYPMLFPADLSPEELSCKAC